MFSIILKTHILIVLIFQFKLCCCGFFSKDDEGTKVYNRGLKKCCYEGEGIKKMYSSESGQVFYECVIPLMANNDFLSLNVTIKMPLVALRSSFDNENVTYGFPKCSKEDTIEVALDKVKYIPEEYCVDKILVEQRDFGAERVADEPLVVVTCLNQPKGLRNGFVVRNVAKCCMGDLIYSTETHTCSNMSSVNATGNDKKMFEQFVDSEVDLLNVRYGLSCMNTKTIYEYNSLDYEFNWNGDDLVVKRFGKVLTLQSGSFCLDDGTEGLLARGCRVHCGFGNPCVSKCCGENQVYMFPNNSCNVKAVCTTNYRWGFSPKFYDISDPKDPVIVNLSSMGVTYEPSCPAGKYLLDPSSPADRYFLDSRSGSLLIPSLPIPMQEAYCLETVESGCVGLHSGFYGFVCFPEKEDLKALKSKLEHYSYGLIVSCVFLAATLLVYVALPALQNLHGRTLMCHVSAMLVGYCCLARVQWGNVPPGMPCLLLGYAIYFSFLSAFSWLNVMCFDIWWTFGNTRSIVSQRKKATKKFLLLSVYAWGVPLLLTISTYLMDHYRVLPGWLDADIGMSYCWFPKTKKAPYLILFILPMGTQILINSVLFIKTAIYCSKVKSEIHRMQAGSAGDRKKKRFTADKAKYAMNFKLFIVMGITWVWEIISTLHSDLEMWYILDLVNIFQGIPIFCILVLKKKVFYLIKKRLGIEEPPRSGTNGHTSTTGTSSVREPSVKKSLLSSNQSSASLPCPTKN